MDTENIKQTIRIHASLQMMKFDEASSYTNLILSKLYQQREEGKFCDAVFSVDKKELGAHKCVLAASSAYFETIFSESEYSPNNQKIQVFSKCPGIVVQILDYMYTGRIVINTDNVAEVVDLASRFSLTKLQDYCSKYLVSNINDKTCFHIQDLARQHGLSSLVKAVDGFVFANILKLIESDAILEVSLSSLEILIGRSVPLLEPQRLDVICRWIEQKRNIRKDSFPIILKIIHWSKIPAKDLDQFIHNSEMVKDDDWMYFHVLLSLNNADLLPETYKEKFASLKQIFMKDNQNTTKESNESVEISRVNDEIVEHLTTSFPINDNTSEIGSPVTVPAAPPVKRESSRLALKLKKVQELGNQMSASDQGKKKASKKKKSKDADKENSTQELNVEPGDVKSNREVRARKKLVTPKSVGLRRKGKCLPRGEKVSCSECTFKTNQKERLARHMRVTHGDRNKTFSCDICNFQCKWNRQFYDHLRASHFPGPPFHCDRCGHTAVSIQLLLLHRMDHSELRPHCCSTCGARFKVKYVLEAHVRSHTGEKPFTCTVCHRSFATKGTLDQHKSIHSPQRPYLCHLCGFSTKYQSHMKTHSRLHTGEVFQCQFESCNYRTPKRSQLACHQRSHLHVRCHTCSTCGHSFVERSHLVRHEKIHLDERPFRCELCDYASTRRDKLNEHCKKHHDPSSGETNKMAYRPRKSRLKSSINSTLSSSGGKSMEISPASSSAASKSLSLVRKRPLVTRHASKRKFGHETLGSIPEDAAVPCEPGARNSSESSVVFVKRASNMSQLGKKIRVGSEGIRDSSSLLLMREAEMRAWLAKTTKEPPISPIKVDTGDKLINQPAMTDISPHLHSFSSHFSSSSGISKGHSGASSSGVGTGETNLLISPSTNTAITSDMSSPGAGSSSSQNLGLSPTSGTKTVEQPQGQQLVNIYPVATDNHAGDDVTCLAIDRPFVMTSQTLAICSQGQSFSNSLNSQPMTAELQAAKKKLVQDRIKRMVSSKISTPPMKKIILHTLKVNPSLPLPSSIPLPSSLPPPPLSSHHPPPPSPTQPISVVTFKPDGPPRSGGSNII